MTKSVIVFVIPVIVLLTVFVWLLNERLTWNLQELIMIAGIVVVVGFAIFIGISHLHSAARSETPEDELSKKIMTKTSSISLYISINF